MTNETQVDLRHQDAAESQMRISARLKSESQSRAPDIVEMGIDLSEFYKSVEWDILGVPAARNVKFYTCCDEPYLDITFNITMRRKTLFYTVNLIIPCMGISFLTVLVFYLPSDSGEKVSLSINILLSLTVFFLLLAEIIPPTSLVVPLLGKLVLFTMILDTFSICVTIVVLNIHFRSPQTHTMAPWIRRVFIHILPRLLVMKRPPQARQMFNHNNQQTGCQKYLSKNCNGVTFQEMDCDAFREIIPVLHNSTKEESKSEHGGQNGSLSHSYYLKCMDRLSRMGLKNENCQLHGDFNYHPSLCPLIDESNVFEKLSWKATCDSEAICPELSHAVEGVRYIAEITRREEDSNKVREDWKYVAMVLDRLFLWIFTIAVIVGTAGIILQAL